MRMPTSFLEDSLLEPSWPLLFSKIWNKFTPSLWIRLWTIHTLSVGCLREQRIFASYNIGSLRTHLKNVFLDRRQQSLSSGKKSLWEPEYITCRCWGPIIIGNSILWLWIWHFPPWWRLMVRLTPFLPLHPFRPILHHPVASFILRCAFTPLSFRPIEYASPAFHPWINELRIMNE